MAWVEKVQIYEQRRLVRDMDKIYTQDQIRIQMVYACALIQQVGRCNAAYVVLLKAILYSLKDVM